jgi:hypothetical protein
MKSKSVFWLLITVLLIGLTIPHKFLVRADKVIK